MNYLSIENIIHETIQSIFGERLDKIERKNFHKSIINIINKEFHRLRFLRLEKEDFLYVVFVAISEIENKYNPAMNIPLIPYANYIIKRRILDYSRNLRREKRKVTLQTINAYRGNMYNQERTFLEKDIDDYSYGESRETERNQEIKEILESYVQAKATELEKTIIKLLYWGYTQKNIVKILKIERYEIVKCKENLKKYFISFIK